MKKISFPIVVIFGLMLCASFALADLSIQITPSTVNILPGSSATVDVFVGSTPQTNHSVYIGTTICKVNPGSNTCEFLINNPSGSGEARVFFENNQLSTTTDSQGKTKIIIALGSGASMNANYLFKVRASDGGWQEASITSQSVAIPEFFSPALPALLSLISFGIVSTRMKLQRKK